jgi:hypothetical protein
MLAGQGEHKDNSQEIKRGRLGLTAGNTTQVRTKAAWA